MFQTDHEGFMNLQKRIYFLISNIKTESSKTQSSHLRTAGVSFICKNELDQQFDNKNLNLKMLDIQCSTIVSFLPNHSDYAVQSIVLLIIRLCIYL